MKILLAGATGTVGKELLPLLKDSGYTIRTLCRNQTSRPMLSKFTSDMVFADSCKAKNIEGICQDIDVIISVMGGSLSLKPVSRASYFKSDFTANYNLLNDAKKNNVKRFVYLSVHPEIAYQNTAYVKSHLEFEKKLSESNLSYGILRPTGLFHTFKSLSAIAKAIGVLPLIGNGKARTNPVHECDVAETLLKFIHKGHIESMGGNAVYSRKEISDIIFNRLGKKARYIPYPAFLMKFGALLVKPIHPRMGQLLEFMALATCNDSIADQTGSRNFTDYHFNII